MPSNDADGNIPTDNLEDHSIFRRPVRTYVIRAGRMTENEKRSYEELHHVWCIPFGKNKTRCYNKTSCFTWKN